MADKSCIKFAELEILPPEHHSADALWLDEQILAGRMYLGEFADHAEICRAIESDRMVMQLIYRLREHARLACR